MTKVEMDRRLATMDEALIERIRDMIRLGYGNIGIFHETPSHHRPDQRRVCLGARRVSPVLVSNAGAAATPPGAA
jgi:hypothetical protein